MPMYHYEASERSGKKLVGSMEARDEQDLRSRLASRGLTPIVVQLSDSSRQATPVQAVAAPARASAAPRPTAARASVVVPSQTLAAFYRQLGTLVRSGVSLPVAMRSMRQGTRDRILSAALEDMDATIQSGRPISEAMMRHPRAFGSAAVGLIAAGETSGNLERALEELAAQAELDTGNQRALNLGVLYQRYMLLPVVAAVGYIVLGAGRISAAGGSLAAVMTLVTQGLVFGVIVTVAVNLLLPFLLRLLRGTALGPVIDGAAASIPGVSGRVRRMDRARTLQSLASAMDAGVPLTNAWRLATDAAESPAARRRMADQAESIRQGTPVAQALQATGLFDSASLQLVYTGEAAGTLPEMLRRASEIQAESGRYAARRNATAAGFAVMVLFALIGGGIVLMVGLRYAATLSGLVEQAGSAANSLAP